ncbi:MAG: hypothetical protein E5W65_31115 [Mesorhizobium sp.]|nr:MAG: hypothetical protein E5W65_31115 [Mesorhizobium sp.]
MKASFVTLSPSLEPQRCPSLSCRTFLPYSDGEKEAVAESFANRKRCRTGAGVAASLLLPVTIRGEGAGRRMRGDANR